MIKAIKSTTPEPLRGFKARLGTGARLPVSGPLGELGLETIVTVATIEVAEDLKRLLPTALRHTNARIVVYCDQPTYENLATYEEAGVVIFRPVLTNAALAEAEAQLENLTHQNSYWKPGPIWWKLRALELCLEEFGPTMMVDSDIVFTSKFADKLPRNRDAKLSPFYWPNPYLKVPLKPGEDKKVPIAERDGFFNAGYLWARGVEVATAWRELYEAGVGGFYEQWCMGFLPGLFKCSYFDERHNHGNWRDEAPDDTTVSVHIHPWIDPQKPSLEAVQVFAEKAV